MSETVALIGVGKMGRALLGRLTAAGHAVRAYDIKDEPMEAARAGGAEACTSSAEAASGAAIVHVFVHNDDEVFAATTGPAGVLEGAAPGTLVMVHSTVLPATTQKVAEAGAARGIDVIDASVTSVPRRLAAGEGVFLMGAPEHLAERARDHLLGLGKAVHHFGPTGAGHAAKIAKNLANAVERVMLAETLRIVEAAGLDARQYLDMARSLGASAMVQAWERVIEITPTGTRPGRARGMFAKDIQHAARLARDFGIDAPVTQATADCALKWYRAWESGRDPYAPEDDYSSSTVPLKAR